MHWEGCPEWRHERQCWERDSDVMRATVRRQRNKEDVEILSGELFADFSHNNKNKQVLGSSDEMVDGQGKILESRVVEQEVGGGSAGPRQVAYR